MLIDTHCHLHFDAFDPDREAVIQRSRDFGVRYLVNVGTCPASNPAAHELAKRYPFVFHTAGLHPHHAHEVIEDDWEVMDRFIRETHPVAVGEIGLDYFKSQASPEIQKKIFSRMLALARQNRLPVIVHSRNAFEDTLGLLKSEGKGLGGVMHCFSYDVSAMKKLFDLGFLVSFTCNLTFKNNGALLEVAKTAPLDRVMLETDSPYLAPQIYRGKRNEPSCLVHLAQFLADHRKEPLLELERTTSETSMRFFGLPVEGAHA